MSCWQCARRARPTIPATFPDRSLATLIGDRLLPSNLFESKRTWTPEAHGTVSVQVHYDVVEIDFDDVYFSNPSARDELDLGTVLLHGSYWAPYSCYQTV